VICRGVRTVKTYWDRGKVRLALHGRRAAVYYQDRQLDTPYCTIFVHGHMIGFFWHPM
jgi:hypothetical protein